MVASLGKRERWIQNRMPHLIYSHRMYPSSFSTLSRLDVAMSLFTWPAPSKCLGCIPKLETVKDLPIHLVTLSIYLRPFLLSKFIACRMVMEKFLVLVTWLYLFIFFFLWRLWSPFLLQWCLTLRHLWCNSRNRWQGWFCSIFFLMPLFFAVIMLLMFKICRCTEKI